MSQPSEDEVVIRAYELWEKNGRPEGLTSDFLALAAEELRNEDPVDTSETLDTF